MSNPQFDALFASSFSTKTARPARSTRPAKINHDEGCQDDSLDYVIANLDAIGDEELLAAVLRSA